jgi:4-diphosphocytidyl-2-C-methyl-D-erythritol kinase
MLRFPNAKINIGLFITEKRADGYHNLETVFYPVKPADALELIDHDAQTTTIKLSGLEVAGNNEDNLVWKAWQLLQRDFPSQVRPLHIFLHKVIPMGAGMGGGSSDGAFLLCMLNDHFRLGLSTGKLEAYALQLGSDCPFFIRNQPAFAAGRGELLEPLHLDLSDYTLQIICPQIHVSTAAAFKGIKPARPPFNLKEINSLPVSDWKQHIRNDFEDSVFQLHPVLQEIKESLYAQGALYASMSGTGAALYGIFKKGTQATVQAPVPFSTYLN